MKVILFSLCAILWITAMPARATEQKIHQEVKHSLVRLKTTGTARIGPMTGTEVTSNGTGFFVGSDGYILTAAHLFDSLKKVKAVNVSIEARFEGTGTGSVVAVFVSELSSLDLVLLRAIVDNGIVVPTSLEIGDSKDVDLGAPALLTSGYDSTGYRARALGFNSTSNVLASFAWTVNGKTNSGASGSPVYIEYGGRPLVVGILSATAKDDDELSLMIPIEYSFQLIGQFKMKELQEQVAQLRRMLGDATGGKPALNNRVDDLERSVGEIKENFTWSAITDDTNGTLVVKYRKLVSDGPHIDKIIVKIQPYLYVDVTERSSIRSRKAVASLTWSGTSLARQSPEPEERTGTFVVDKFAERLTRLIEDTDGTVKDGNPFRDIVVTIVADVHDATLKTELSVVPKFTWHFEQQ